MKVYICPNCKIELIEKKFDYIMLYYCLECNYKDIKRIAPCCSTPNHQYKKFYISNGTITLRKQCESCGKLLPNAYKKTDVDNINDLKDVNIDLAKKRDKNEDEEYKQANAFKKDLFLKKHTEYLETIQWNVKRNLVLKRDKLCQSCLQNKATQVHHLSYLFWKNEPLFTLIGVCEDCHDIITKMERANKVGQPIDNIPKIKHKN